MEQFLFEKVLQLHVNEQLIKVFVYLVKKNSKTIKQSNILLAELPNRPSVSP